MDTGWRAGFCAGKAGRLHNVDFGGWGRTILALHGVTGNAFLWQGFAEALREDFRVVALDFRGHGKSDWSESQAYSTADYVDDLQAVLDHLEAGPVILAGASWGALAALSYSIQFPKRVTELLIVDVEPSFAASPDDVHPRPAEFDSFADVLAWERQANPHAPEDALKAFAMGSVHNVDGKYRRRHDPFFFSHWPFRADDRWAELRQLATPTLIVRGAQSFVQAQVCQRMAQACRQARLVEVAESGHLVPLEQPLVLAHAAKRFLEEAPTLD